MLTLQPAATGRAAKCFKQWWRLCAPPPPGPWFPVPTDTCRKECSPVTFSSDSFKHPIVQDRACGLVKIDWRPVKDFWYQLTNLISSANPNILQAKGGGKHLKSQHSGDWGKKNAVSSKPAWAISWVRYSLNYSVRPVYFCCWWWFFVLFCFVFKPKSRVVSDRVLA